MNRFCVYLFLLLITFGLFATEVRAQFFTSGEDPASVEWKQMHTPNFQVIFPADFKDKAMYVSNILEYAYERGGQSLDHQPDKVSVIIHNRTVTSNGFVAPAPHRMELYSVPPQHNLDMPWLEHLAIHELRHVVQIDKLDQGLTRLLGFLFGEQANAVVAGMLPMWYLEGDAVIAETALTQDGRGRLPSFTKNIRARLRDSATLFSFDKMLMGSYKHPTPDHYELGYHMASYGRMRYGTDLWEQVQDHVGQRPYQLMSFNLGLNRFSGLYSRGLYDSAMTYFTRVYDAPEKDARESRRLLAGEGHEDYRSYRFPLHMGDNEYLALRKDFSHLPRIVRITGKKEETIHKPGRMTFDRISYGGGLVVWSERVPDLRWSNRSYSVVKIYDLERDAVRTLQHKTRWFAPDVSPRGHQVVAVEVTRDNSYALVTCNVNDAGDQRRFAHPGGIFLQQPVWSDNGKFVYAIGLTDQGKGLYRLDPATGSWTTVMKPVYKEVNHLSAGPQYIYFRAAQGGREQIFALDPESGNKYQLTHDPVNASDVSFSEHDNALLYASYQASGYDIYAMPLDRGAYQPVSLESDTEQNMVKRLREQESKLYSSQQVPQHQYDVQPYSRLLNLFHFHSWTPFYMNYNMSNPAITDIAPGVTLLSQNLLSTAITTLGYSYRNQAHHLHSHFTYKGWYPVVEFSTDYGGKPEVVRHSSVNWAPELNNDFIRFNASLSLPLNLSRGKNITGFTPSVSYEYDRNYYHHYGQDYFLRGLKTLDYGLWFYSYNRMAYRDILPRWGLTFNMNVRTSPFSEDILGDMTSMKARVFMPGLFQDHGISLAAGYQKQDPEAYLYSSYLQFPRGLEARATEKLYTFESEYAFPLAYPDWNIPSVLYVKRLKGTMFFDYAWNEYRRRENDRIVWNNEPLYSAGAEWTADFHLARIMFPFTAGVRYAYLPQFSDHRFELIFNVDFYRIYSKLF